MGARLGLTLLAAVALAAGCGGAGRGGWSCAQRGRPWTWVHVEYFAHGRVVLLPAGLGIAPPLRREGAYVRGGRCRYPLWTDEPTGLVAVDRPGLRLGDLARVWPRPLRRVRAFVGGRRWRGDPRAIPLSPHAQIVLQDGPPLVAPHARYRFPTGH